MPDALYENPVDEASYCSLDTVSQAASAYWPIKTSTLCHEPIAPDAGIRIEVHDFRMTMEKNIGNLESDAKTMVRLVGQN